MVERDDVYSKTLPSSYRLYKQPLTCKSTQPFGKKSSPCISNTFKLAINTQQPSTQIKPFNIKHVPFIFRNKKHRKNNNIKMSHVTQNPNKHAEKHDSKPNPIPTKHLIGFSAHGQDDDVTTHGQAFQGRSQRLQGSLMPPMSVEWLKRANPIPSMGLGWTYLYTWAVNFLW